MLEERDQLYVYDPEELKVIMGKLIMQVEINDCRLICQSSRDPHCVN